MAEFVEIANLNQATAALLGLSAASGPKVRTALSGELEGVRDAMRCNALAGLTKRSTGASDFTKSIKSFVFYRTKKDIDLGQVGGAVKAYARLWAAHETGATITADGDKWLLIVLPEGVRDYGGKSRKKYPIGTIVRPVAGHSPDEMLGIYKPLKTKLKLIALLKKVVKLKVRVALVETAKHASRDVARALVRGITLGNI
jgi:hypothetical protein